MKNRLFKALNRSKTFRGLTEEEFSWVLYDVGNSAYTMLACSLIPIWFHAMADKVYGENEAAGIFALATSIVTIVTALIGPICGVLSDKKDRRKIFFQTAVLIGVIGAILTGLVPYPVLFLVVYGCTRVAYQASNTFYDSMLNDVTTEDRADQVSSYGYAWGYIGSCIPFIVALLAYVLSPDMLGVLSAFTSKLIGCAVTAAWWLIVTLPLFKLYKQKNYVENGANSVGKVFRELWTTIRTIVREDKKVMFFLLAFFLYIDGVGTIIDNCINLAEPLGINTVGSVIFLLATQVVAWGGSLVFAKLAKKHDTIKLLLACIVGYFVVCVYALFFLNNLWSFGIMAFGVGCFQGSIQSLSRSYFAKIIPPEHSGEYFGIYDIFSKGASFLGSFVIYLVINVFKQPLTYAIGSLAIFFGLGYLFLVIAGKQKSRREDEVAAEE